MTEVRSSLQNAHASKLEATSVWFSITLQRDQGGARDSESVYRPRRQRGKTLQLQQDLAKTGVGQRLEGWARPCPCLLASSAALQPSPQLINSPAPEGGKPVTPGGGA